MGKPSFTVKSAYASQYENVLQQFGCDSLFFVGHGAVVGGEISALSTWST